MDGTTIERLTHLLAERAWLARLARGLTRDESAAEDLAQEAWLAAWQKGPEAARSWRAWLAETARHLASGTRRTDARRARREHAVARGEGQPASDELVAKSELLELVARETLALDEPFRRTLLLRFQEDLEPAAIAAREGVAADTVRFRLRRGLELLRARLERRLGAEWRARVLFLVPLSRVPLPHAAGSGATVATAVGGVLVGKTILAVAVGLALLWVLFDRNAEREPRPVIAEVSEAAASVASESEASARSAAPASEAVRTQLAATENPAAPDEASRDVCVVVGRVVGEQDEPLAGVQLSSVASGKWKRYAPTDADGAFRAEVEHPEAVQALQLEPDPYHELWIVLLQGDDPGAPPLAAGRRDLGTIRLGATGAIEGRVVSAAGAPVERAYLVVTDYPSLGWPYAWSDASGAYQVGHVRAGEWELRVNHLGFRIPRASVGVALGATTTQDFVLEPGPPVAGHVRDEDGAPLEGIEVHPCGYWYDWGVATEADGSFELPLASDEPCVIEVSVEGYDVVSGLGIAYAPGTRDIEIVLRRGTPFRFRVVDASGAPIESFGLAVEQANESFTGPSAAKEHPGGECVTDAREGDGLHVSAPGYVEFRGDVLPDVPGQAFMTVELERGASIAGRVERAGRPVAGASVHLARRYGSLHAPSTAELDLFVTRDSTDALAGVLDPDPPAYPGRAWRTLDVRSSADGSFAFTGLDGGGPWSLEASAADGASARREGIAEPAELGTLAIEEPVSLSGVLEFARPGSLAGHEVVLESLPQRRVRTDERGAFAFDGVSPGEHWLRVLPSAERAAAATVFFLRLQPGLAREVVLRVEDRAATRLGLTLLENGIPMEDPGVVSFLYDDGSEECVRLYALEPDVTGRVELTVPAGGSAWLEVSGPFLSARHPDRVRLLEGAVEHRADFVSGAVELVLPAGLAAAEGAELALLVRPASLSGWEARLAGTVREGRVLAEDRRVLGALAEGHLSFPSVPVGPCDFELRLDGRSLGRASGVVSPDGPLRTEPR
jgi:RNA polymerase sigma factor (sigma-70 family)